MCKSARDEHPNRCVRARGMRSPCANFVFSIGGRAPATGGQAPGGTFAGRLDLFLFFLIRFFFSSFAIHKAKAKCDGQSDVYTMTLKLISLVFFFKSRQRLARCGQEVNFIHYRRCLC